MIKTNIIWILLLLALILPTYSTAQTLEYRYGEDGSQNLQGDAGRSGQLRQGLNQVFGAGSSGAVGGAIGTSIPDASVSQRHLEDELARKQALTDRWAALNQSVPIDPKVFLDNYNEKKIISGMLKYKADGNPDDLATWKSSDPAFKRRAADVLYEVRLSKPTKPEMGPLKNVSENAVTLADTAFSNNDGDSASFYFSVAQACADVLIGVDPVTGTLRAVYEAVTGNNLITGAELTDFERGVAIFGVVTIGFGGEIVKGIQLFKMVAINSVKDATLFNKAITYATFVAEKFRLFRAASSVESSAPRFVKILVEAGSGPSQRAAQLMATYETVESGVMRLHPELYRITDGFVMNLSLGEATRTEAEIVGQAFVGEGAIESAYRQDPSVKIFRSADGRRVYRQPMLKQSMNRYQANLEVFAPPGSGRTLPLSDAHLDIK